MSECPYIVGNECDIAKCEEFHVSRKEKIELLDKVLEKIKDCSYEMYSDISPYPETVVDMEDIDLIICGLKAEVEK